MPTKNAKQVTIDDRLDAAIEAIITDGLKPTSIFLAPDDKIELHEAATRRWRDHGGGATAYVFPCSYKSVPVISEKLVEHYEIPVREHTGRPRRSTVYASNGRGYLA